ncbi:MAG: hypothetical protein M0015_15185, partial [Betaproteobacteria bacterium]|nr:hypothetical protein [Betaproteobacteria bacterium]
FLAVVWLTIAIGLVVLVTRKLPPRWWKAPLRALLVIAVFPLPLIDEIVGGIQFRQLCRENATIHVDQTTAAGRTVYLADVPNRQLEGTWVPVTLTEWRYVDVKTGATVISYNTLAAAPGYLHLSGAPLTFKGYCAPGGSRRTANDLLRDLHITVIERPKDAGVTK